MCLTSMGIPDLFPRISAVRAAALWEGLFLSCFLFSTENTFSVLQHKLTYVWLPLCCEHKRPLLCSSFIPPIVTGRECNSHRLRSMWTGSPSRHPCVSEVTGKVAMVTSDKWVGSTWLQHWASLKTETWGARSSSVSTINHKPVNLFAQELPTLQHNWEVAAVCTGSAKIVVLTYFIQVSCMKIQFWHMIAVMKR